MASERVYPIIERPMDAPLLTFDLPAVLVQIRREDTWANAPRTGLTLLKGQRLLVVLVALHAGTTISSHHTDSPISVQVIEGALTFTRTTTSTESRCDDMPTVGRACPLLCATDVAG